MSQVVTGCSLHSKAVGIQILEEWRNSIHSLLVSLFSHQYSITSHQMALILMSLDPEGKMSGFQYMFRLVSLKEVCRKLI